MTMTMTGPLSSQARSGPGGRYLVEVQRGVPVVAAGAQIDMSSAGQLLGALTAPLARGHATIVADLTETRSCDPAGIQALADAHRQALAEGGELRVAVSSAGVAQALSAAAAGQVIPLFATLDEALAPVPAIAIRQPG
jgi:anti-anti-sigma factor